MPIKLKKKKKEEKRYFRQVISLAGISLYNMERKILGRINDFASSPLPIVRHPKFYLCFAFEALDAPFRVQPI